MSTHIGRVEVVHSRGSQPQLHEDNFIWYVVNTHQPQRVEKQSLCGTLSVGKSGSEQCFNILLKNLHTDNVRQRSLIAVPVKFTKVVTS